MHRYRTLLLLLCLFLIRLSGYSQVDATLDQLRTVVPPSPNASSLGEFGEWPVSEYTGLPQIAIPLYTLKSRNLTVPISLDYHASGIRVGEIASWVGLGWALNAGGCISRTVHGVPDDYNYFYAATSFSNPNNFCTNFLNQDVGYGILGSGAKGNQDTQQDTYYLDVLGKSYRIYFDADTVFHTMPESNIKITSNYLSNTSSTWTVVLEDGTTLLFGGSYPGSAPCYEQTSGVTFGSDGGGDSYISSWYLRSITAPTGETITFTYTQSNISQDTHFTQSDNVSYFYTAITAGEYDDPPFQPYLPIATRTCLQTVNQLSLSTIQSDLATIYFIPSDSNRLDLQGGESLSEMKVYSNLTHQYVDDWLFTYTYSSCGSGNEYTGGLTGSALSYFHYRLKLMNLTHNPIDNSQPEIWSFTYNPTPLPSRRSYAQDYWGFYNGATGNSALLASVPFNPTIEGLSTNYGSYPFTGIGFMNALGDSHTPNEQYMQAESLTQITYPTGGSTVFNMEGNGRIINQELFADTTLLFQINTVGGSGAPIVDTVNYPFVLTKPEYVNINLSSTISQAILSDFPGAVVYGEVLDSLGTPVAVINGNGYSWFNLYIPGHYTFRLYTNCAQDEFANSTDFVEAAVYFRFQYSHGFQNIKQELGGLRVNNIKDFDGINPNPINSKYYIYASPFVINPVDTVNAYITQQYYILPANPDGSQYEYNKLTRNCATKYSLGSIQGGTVGYGQVTAYDGLNGANGYTVSTFSCDPQTQAGLPASLTFPYPPNDMYEWRNGLLLNETTYTANGVPVKSAQNTYNFLTADRIVNFAVGYSTLNALNTCAGAAYGACGISSVCYSNTNEEVQRVSVTQTDYSTSMDQSLGTTTTYYYDDPLYMQPTRSVSLRSKGDTLLTYSRSPLELSSINASIPLTTAATAAFDTMIARNIVGQPVETERYVAGAVTYKALSNYLVQPSGLVLPSNVMLQNTTNPIEARVNFLAYDNYGNLLEQAKSADQNHNYLYDYLNNFPIAEVTNADTSSIAYTSFEADGTGNWLLGGGTTDTTKGITGTKSYIPSAAISRTGLNSAVTYVVSYWTTASSPYTVAGTTSGYPVKGKTITINGTAWTYYEHQVTGITTASVSGSGNIDELRLYPATAQMTTYTYVPLVGLSAKCDVDNRITYYEYDGLERLKDIKDQDGNVIKTYQYHYSN